MKFNYISYSCVILSILLGTSCGHSQSEGEEHDEHDEHDDHKSEHIRLSHEAEENAGIRTETVQPGKFSDVIRAGGVISNTPTAERIVTAPASGVIRFATDLVAGSYVNQGAAVCSISSKGMEPSDGVVQARAALAAARKQLERGEELYKSNLITKREYETLQSDVASAEAALSGASTRSATTGVAVTAPISGYIVSVNARAGEYLNAGDPIAVISQSRRLMLRADVSERHASSVQNVVSANIVTSDGRSIPLSSLSPRVVAGGAADASQGYYLPVYIEFDNPGGLYSGTNVRTYLLTGERDGVISVPKEALVEEGGVYSVFVEVGHCEYERHDVTIGPSDGIRVEILTGLKPGDKVVTNGAMSVRMAGMGSKIQGHTHHH
ncbi:MAG: efflux RND transporter periplasmic adaptor subunit [Muribaculaceae bacterium]|nr:efflux RND transporter periplasmic adaptor subunit [Muribaculaceae bacterium]